MAQSIRDAKPANLSIMKKICPTLKAAADVLRAQLDHCEYEPTRAEVVFGNETHLSVVPCHGSSMHHIATCLDVARAFGLYFYIDTAVKADGEICAVFRMYSFK